jgi:ubiquinone/menaquinone biosynthesis C-methylase UbiE
LRVSPLEGHRIWSASYDGAPNPLLALDMRVLSERLGMLQGLRIVDIACGTGRWMTAAHAQGADVLGIDFSMEMLAVTAGKPDMRGRLALAQAGRLPFPDTVADLALCSLAVNYFPSIQEAFAEMARIVRRGGRVVVSDLHPDADTAGWKRSFRAGGISYEIDHDSRDIRHLNEVAELFSLTRAWQVDAHFGTPEQEIFRRAGKQSVFAELSSLPALHLACWTKS